MSVTAVRLFICMHRYIGKRERIFEAQLSLDFLIPCLLRLISDKVGSKFRNIDEKKYYVHNEESEKNDLIFVQPLR